MNSSTFYSLAVCAICFASPWASAITPAEAEKALSQGEQITFVDIRPAVAFKDGHIPNAINIPATLVSQKELPPLGTVVVYDDGLGADLATAAVLALNKKPGITADVLQGGYAAWTSGRSATTQTAGASPESISYITYDKLIQTPADHVVLVDLRGAGSGTTQKLVADPQSDLTAEFPGARVTKSPFEIPASKQIRASSSAEPPLLVLIDNGDGSAQKMARTLKANGVKRYVILAGGDEMIKRKGQSGLDRIGSTVSVRQNSSAPVVNGTK